MVINIVFYIWSIFVYILMIIVYYLLFCVSKNCYAYYYCDIQKFYYNLVLVIINLFNILCICIQSLIYMYLNDEIIVCYFF